MTPVSINDLADEDLRNVFKQLPPYDRLLTSEVCKRWYEISATPWFDVVSLDLSAIPDENIVRIVKQCPNIRTVCACGREFSLNQLHLLSQQANLSSLKLYRASVTIPESQKAAARQLSAVLSGGLPSNAAWEELVLYKVYVPRDSDAVADGSHVIGTLPVSLKRLQLNAVRLTSPQEYAGAADLLDRGFFVNGIAQLRQLTCLSLLTSRCQLSGSRESVISLRELRTLKSLCELCIGSDIGSHHFGKLDLDLPGLEVLFLHNVVFFCIDDVDELAQLTTKHPALRILCITGLFNEVCACMYTIPVRRRFPNGFGSDPVPKVHVFLGKKPSEKIIFTKSPAYALAIHPISKPLPEFLEKEEIAPLFDGVWLAAQIKEGAKHGADWWKSEGDTAFDFHTADDA